MSAHVYLGGTAITALVVAAVLQSATPIKPLDAVVAAVVTIINAATPIAFLGVVGVAIYVYANR